MERVFIARITIALLLLFVFSNSPPVVIPQGSSFATAQLIQKGTYHFALVQGADHYFKIQVATTDRLFVFLAYPIGSDYDLYIYDSSQTQVASSITTTSTDWIRLAWPLVDTLYYIKVDYVDGPGGTYDLTVGPLVISSGTYPSTFYENGAELYEFHAEANWAVEINMTQPPGTDIDVRLFDSEGDTLSSSTRVAGYVEHISTTLLETGPYYIWIFYYSGPGGAHELTLLTGPEVTVSIQGLPASQRVNVQLGGRTVGGIAGGGSLDIIIADGRLTTISVPEDVSQTNQVRYHCYNTSWYPSTSSHDFTYVLQYLLETSNGGHGTVSPTTGWYDSGASVAVSVSATTIQSGNDTKYLFQRWDGASTSSSDRVTILMDSAKTISAVWKTQYFLKVISQHGTPTGEGWYDSGGNAQISVDESVGFIPVRYVFESWTGTGVSSPTSRSTTVEMSAPRTVTAVWREDYMYTIVAGVGAVVIIGVAVFLVMRRKPSPPQPSAYVPPPPPI